MDDKHRLISEGRPSRNGRPNGYNGNFNPSINNSRKTNIQRPNNYGMSKLTPPPYNYNEPSYNEEFQPPPYEYDNMVEEETSKSKNKVSDISSTIVKTEKTISFFAKYKFIIIGVVIAIAIVILFIFLMMVVDLDGGSVDDDGGKSYPTSSYLANVYDECKSIRVKGYDKLFDLEEYVAGVVTAENITSMGIEALKAHAIVARTYGITRSGYCKNPIEASSNDQNFTTDIVEKARQAAEETAGIVLTYDGKMFQSQYDSYCYQAEACPDSSCNGDTCTVTYTKEPNNEKHVISIPSSWSGYFVPVFGHGQGMSQLVAYHMAEEGSNYEEILKFFYSPGVVLSQLTNKSTGINSNVNLLPFKIRTTEPTRSDWAWTGDYSASNVGQCVWYTKGRMIEIINESVSDENKKKSSIDVINSTYGNACAWYNQSLLNTFGGSDNVNDYKIGSLIVWKYAGSECNYNNNYGHVAIIENITEDGKVAVTEGYASGGNSCPSTWDCVEFIYREFKSTSEFTSWVKNNQTAAGIKYDFLGYIHFLG